MMQEASPLVPQGTICSITLLQIVLSQVFDANGFAAKWGPRTAERRAADYNFSCAHECTWNGPSWPFETSRLVTGLASLLNSNASEACLGPLHCTDSVACTLLPVSMA